MRLVSGSCLEDPSDRQPFSSLVKENQGQSLVLGAPFVPLHYSLHIYLCVKIWESKISRFGSEIKS